MFDLIDYVDECLVECLNVLMDESWCNVLWFGLWDWVLLMFVSDDDEEFILCVEFMFNVWLCVVKIVGVSVMYVCEDVSVLWVVKIFVNVLSLSFENVVKRRAA